MDVSPKGRFAESISPKGNFGQSYHNVGRKIFGGTSVRRNVLSAKRPFGETSFRRNVLSVKRPFGETSIRRNVHSVKRPFGETSIRRNGFGEMEFGETAFSKTYRNPFYILGKRKPFKS